MSNSLINGIKIDEVVLEGPESKTNILNSIASQKAVEQLSGQQILKPKIHNIEVECRDVLKSDGVSGGISGGGGSIIETIKEQNGESKLK